MPWRYWRWRGNFSKQGKAKTCSFMPCHKGKGETSRASVLECHGSLCIAHLSGSGGGAVFLTRVPRQQNCVAPMTAVSPASPLHRGLKLLKYTTTILLSRHSRPRRLFSLPVEGMDRELALPLPAIRLLPPFPYLHPRAHACRPSAILCLQRHS